MKEIEKSPSGFSEKVLQVIADNNKKKEQNKQENWKDNIQKIRKKVKVSVIKPEESKIWEDVRSKLKPIEQSKKEKADIKNGLNTLRTETFLLFVNVAFIFVVFLLQVRFQNMNRFSVNWPLCK